MVVSVYGLRMIGMIGVVRGISGAFLLPPEGHCIVNVKRENGNLNVQKVRTLRSTPALPNASFKVAISAVSIPLLLVLVCLTATGAACVICGWD